ncbi:hypothetical protein BJN34_17405 [Cupriavidus necator]|uniref:Uncharacterized protein n=1 Tax=Cupriavidus necator TaxID=106590 RepID=A0A1U9USR5_CUPNE|nr:hypothetical protein [Cupriavidus necator]AQV95660.1 hypothetical protein BJN34_17405 [Cupriavidus necator]
MTVWRTRSVAEVPAVLLVNWAIFRINNGELHFVGVRPDKGTGRVSSAIAQLDVVQRIGVTRSGRVYALEGRPGLEVDARYVWDTWCRLNGVTVTTDVTRELLHSAGSHSER